MESEGCLNTHLALLSEYCLVNERCDISQFFFSVRSNFQIHCNLVTFRYLHKITGFHIVVLLCNKLDLIARRMKYMMHLPYSKENSKFFIYVLA